MKCEAIAASVGKRVVMVVDTRLKMAQSQTQRIAEVRLLMQHEDDESVHLLLLEKRLKTPVCLRL